MSLRGIGLVAGQEMRTRLRAGRWRWLLGVWFVVASALAALFRWALEAEDSVNPAVSMFGGVMLFVLLLTLLVAPALTAQSINGDRERGTLATLQLTRLSAADIVLGKLLAAWGVGLVVLGVTLPIAAWPVLEGAIGVGRAVVVTLVVALLIGVVCVVSMALSALVTRSITSALLSYLTVFALMAGTPLLYFLALPLTTVTVYEESVGEVIHYEEDRSERIWWLLAPNPFVVLADAAPRLPKKMRVVDGYEREPFDPLGDIGHAVREAREGTYGDAYIGERPMKEPGPVWTYGLAFDLVLAGGAVWITTRRLRTPAHKISRGVRIA
ncbi:ABC transporter permease [Thermomonospora umbrina]|uniref:ABC-2 family transporter n=1 Tax=Thermomonospora umbrina TaxID=111806 RepID=A0A3D9T2X1_9ACTN|nr:ABC transporter permease subunit [Thermomonospora umbrina]REE98171.1 ABC-2 family transporter [Thermomonospora umbrina]